MKKIILSSSIFLASVAGAFAQTAAGNIAIGGTLGVQLNSGKTTVGSTSVDKGKSSSITILPNVSYFLSDKLAIGLGIGYGSTSSTTSGTPSLKTTNSGFIVNPFAKYFISVGEKSSFFFKGGIDMNFGTTKSQKLNAAGTGVEDNDPAKSTTIGVGVMPGFLFFPADNWGVELALGGNLIGYKTSTSKVGSNYKDTDNTFEILGVNGMGAGVSVYYFIK